MRRCEPHHAEIGASVSMKDEFMKSFPHSSFRQGQILKVAGDLRYVKFHGRSTPLWLNRTLIDFVS